MNETMKMKQLLEHLMMSNSKNFDFSSLSRDLLLKVLGNKQNQMELETNTTTTLQSQTQASQSLNDVI